MSISIYNYSRIYRDIQRYTKNIERYTEIYKEYTEIYIDYVIMLPYILYKEVQFKVIISVNLHTYNCTKLSIRFTSL